MSYSDNIENDDCEDLIFHIACYKCRHHYTTPFATSYCPKCKYGKELFVKIKKKNNEKTSK